MRLFVTGATSVVEKLAPSCQDVLGSFPVPGAWNNPAYVMSLGLPVAMDNGCFAGLNAPAFVKMLDRYKPYADDIDWVVTPDVLEDWKGTVEFWKSWMPVVRDYGYRACFVLQNDMPFPLIKKINQDALFIGGDTRYKLSKEVVQFVRWAREKNKPVHMGRVNSYKRISYAIGIGCTSCDGSGYSKHATEKIPPAVDLIRQKIHSVPVWYRKFGKCQIPQE